MNKHNPISIRSEEQEQVRQKKDLKKVILLNLLFLAALVVLYFINQSTGFLDKVFVDMV